MSKKGGEGGGSSPIQKISLQIYAYLRIFWKKAQCNFQGRLEIFQKNIDIWGDRRPLYNDDDQKAWAGLGSDISYYLNSHHIDLHVWAMQVGLSHVCIFNSDSHSEHHCHHDHNWISGQSSLHLSACSCK